MTTPAHRIKRGVSLYSFQEEYFLRTMSLEDCIRVAGDIGARGIEIIPEQSIPGFPHLTDEFVDDLVRLDGEVRDDAGRHRPVPRHQALPRPLADPRGAGRLLPPRHRHRRPAGREGRPRDHQHPAGGHGGRRARTPRRRASGCCSRCTRRSTTSTRGSCEHLEVMHRTQSPALGLMPDMGTYVRALPRAWSASGAARRRASPSWSTSSSRPTTTTATPTRLMDIVNYRDGGPVEIGLARQATHYIWTDPKVDARRTCP